MQVIVKSGAIVRHQMQKEVAKPAALSQMKDKYRSEKFKSTDQWHIKRGYFSDAKKNVAMIEKNFDKVNPESLSPEAKDLMWRRAKQLKDEFSVGMLSYEELHPVKGFSENGTTKWVIDEERMHALRSIERNTAWNAKNEKKVREYKNIMRHLCPDNPNAGDIEKFRPRLKGIR